MKAYRNSVLYVNLVSIVDCSVLNWVEQKELRGLASDGMLFGRIAEPGWVLMDFNNHFKCRMGREDLSHVQFNPKLWNLRPVVKDIGEAMLVPLWREAYAHVKGNQEEWLSGSRPLPDQYPRYPQTPLTPISLLSFKSHSIRWLEQQWMRSTETLGGHWVGSSLPNALIVLQAARSEHPEL